jgi:phage replication-related protein YjqB (UPF0714/DUF867 family)
VSSRQTTAPDRYKPVCITSYHQGVKDHFRNFEELRKARPDSFEIEEFPRQSNFLLFAPHGGGIEPGTTEICRWFLKTPYSLYTFTARGLNCRRLHITSTNFNEPTLLDLLSSHDNAISFHGMTNDLSREINADIYLGGLNETLIEVTTSGLRKNGYQVRPNFELIHNHLGGREKENITNKCRSGMGMQVEISEKLRQTFFKGKLGLKAGRGFTTNQLDKFCNSILDSVLDYERNSLQ